MMKVIELELDDDDDDAHFLSLIEAAEADALASATAGRNKRRTISSVAAGSDQEAAVEIEGSYAAALRGSRSSLWQQQQQQLARPQKKAKDSGSYITAGGVGGGDACFKCGLAGHWARDCSSAGGGDGVGRGGPAVGGVVDEKPCPCGSGSCLVMTSNTAKNPGRKFYRCPLREENGGCSFFEWCDNPSSGIPASGKASTEKSSYGASKWSSEPSSMSRQTSFSSQAQSNRGGYASGQYAGERNSSSCFKCGQDGHWARDCTKSASDSGGGGQLSSSSTGSCFKCGKAGHWARDCTVQDSVAGSVEKKASRSSSTPFVNKY